jgi:hypothetical protein
MYALRRPTYNIEVIRILAKIPHPAPIPTHNMPGLSHKERIYESKDQAAGGGGS